MLKVTIRHNLREIDAKARAALTEAVQQAAEEMAADARSRAPVATGRMRDETTVERTGELSAVVTAAAPYSGFVDMGTSKMAARPWFTPAADRAAEELDERVGRAVENALRGIG